VIGASEQATLTNYCAKSGAVKRAALNGGRLEPWSDHGVLFTVR
jgi:hypothetical protein